TAGTVTTRPTSPRFNWRSPSRISRPTSRFAGVLAIELFLDLPKDIGRNVVRHVLWIKRQHPDLTVSRAQKIDDAEPAPLAAPGDTPAHLAHSPGPRDNRPHVRIRDNRLLKLRIFVVAQVLLH